MNAPHSLLKTESYQFVWLRMCVCVRVAYMHGSCGLSIINWFFWSSMSDENEKRNLNSWNSKYLHAAAAAHTTIRYHIHTQHIVSEEARGRGQDKTTYSSTHKIHICFFFFSSFCFLFFYVFHFVWATKRDWTKQKKKSRNGHFCIAVFHTSNTLSSFFFWFHFIRMRWTFD